MNNSIAFFIFRGVSRRSRQEELPPIVSFCAKNHHVSTLISFQNASIIPLGEHQISTLSPKKGCKYMKNKLIFSISDDARSIDWTLPGTALRSTEGGDFWRLIADDGYHMSMTIRSSQQSGTVTRDGNVTTIKYDSLVTDKGRVIDATLTLTVEEQEDRLVFGSTIENRDEARLDEFQYPFVDMNHLVGERKHDRLIRPQGLGTFVDNPWDVLETAHTEYKSSDHILIRALVRYPHGASMSWIGVQSDNYFLYIGRHDERARACVLLSGIQPREETEPRLINSICNYPCVRTGETLKMCDMVVSMFEGDWRGATEIYGTFARSTFFEPITPRKWVQNMTGWQRIILRHQFGEINYYYKDLPRLYLDGKKHGLDTLLVFGWWKGRFDNGYPHYEIDEELGGEQALKDAIAEVQRLGGRVILYNNGILIDANTEFYRLHHDEAAKKDIDGNEYIHNYRFENAGTMLQVYGYKTFVEACQATEIWYQVMKKNGLMKLGLGADSIFYDQVGGGVRLCFNEKHKHGPRVDDEIYYRRENLERLRAMLNEEQAIGTECTTDSTACKIDYIHGCDKGSKAKDSMKDSMKQLMPEIFRSTFPEVIISNRQPHDCRAGYETELNFAFIHGFRFDVSLYRSRVSVTALPAFGERVERLIKLKEEYHRFFYEREAKYVCETDLSLPAGIRYAEYRYGDERMFAFSNETKADVTLDVLGKSVTVKALDVACISF